MWLVALALGLAVALWRGRSPADRLRAWRADRPRERGRPSHSMIIALAVAAAGAAIALGVSPVDVGAGAAAVTTTVSVRRARRHAQTAALRAAAVVELTFALAGELRAGRTPAESLAAVAAVAGPLAEPVSEAHRVAAGGGSAAEVLARSAALAGADRLRSVASAWRVTETAGGRVAPVLERLGEAMDADLRLRQELEASLAGPRATMLLLAVLPAFGVLLGQAMGANPLRLLLHQPVGWGLLAVAAGLDGFGIWLLRRITASATRC